MDKILHIYDKRAMISVDYGTKCGYGCKYCFSKFTESVNVFNDPEKLLEILQKEEDTYDIITAGCDQELFLNPEKAIEYLNLFSKIGKIVAFATKSHLSSELIEELKKIDQHLKKEGSYLIAEISFISGKERPDIEKYAPSVSGRIKSLQKLHGAGIYVSPFIRPILPDELVPLKELILLVDKTKDFVDAYTLGDFYFNEDIMHTLKLDELPSTFWENVRENIEMEFLKEEQKFFKYVDVKKKKILTEYIKYFDIPVFDSSSDTILSFKDIE